MNCSFVDVSDFLPDFLQEFSSGFPNTPRNFGQYLLKLIFSEFQDETSDQRNTSRQPGENIFTCKQRSPNLKSLITVDEFIPYFVEESAQRFQPADANFAKFVIHLLMRDINDGLHPDVKKCTVSVCKLEQFLERCLQKYADPLDATTCNLKMCYYFKSCKQLNLEYVKEKYETTSKKYLSDLVRSILQYPESSNNKQLEEMFVKMQLFIITNYELGCPQNHILVKQTRQSLNSVLGKGDLQKYVLRKRYHRLEYLQRLGATVCGILLFNNFKAQQGGSGTLRNIFVDLEMAQQNTKESLDEGLKLTTLYSQKGSEVIKNAVKINVPQQHIQYHSVALTKLREINKFVIFFEVYKRKLEQIRNSFQKTQNQVEIDQKKFNCVLAKIKEIVKFRSAIESELIFPHFVYLSEVWASLVLHLNHLVEINKVMDHLEAFVDENLESHYNTILNEALNSCQLECKYAENAFEKLITAEEGRKDTPVCANKIPYIGDYCALTMILTKGLLVPSQLQKKINQSTDTHFGFANTELAKYSERNYVRFKEAFSHVIFNNTDLILLLQLDGDILKQDFDLLKQTEFKNQTAGTQTELLVENNLSGPNKSNGMCNIWDYHRETIRLANIRQKQSHSSQTVISFGKKGSETQAHNTFENFTCQQTK